MVDILDCVEMFADIFLFVWIVCLLIYLFIYFCIAN